MFSNKSRKIKFHFLVFSHLLVKHEANCCRAGHAHGTPRCLPRPEHRQNAGCQEGVCRELWRLGSWVLGLGPWAVHFNFASHRDRAHATAPAASSPRGIKATFARVFDQTVLPSVWRTAASRLLSRTLPGSRGPGAGGARQVLREGL